MMDIRQNFHALLRDPENGVLVTDIFGTRDVESILSALDAFCTSQLGSPIASCLSLDISVGAGVGVALHDGRRVFGKVFRPGTDAAEIEKCCRLQAIACDHGFPAPQVIVSPAPFQDTFAVVQSFLDKGVEVDAHDGPVRAAMAQSLAELVQTLSTAGVSLHRKKRPEIADIWPEPHNALFDFKATAAGAEWIDAKAQKALACIHELSGEPVIGHADWSMKNMRFDGTKMVALYDWDSLVSDLEPLIVGNAAMSYLMTWSLDIELTPTPEETIAFVVDYEKARGSAFSPSDWRAISAAATYQLAYGVRCGHALAEGHEEDSKQIWNADALRSMRSDTYFGI